MIKLNKKQEQKREDTLKMIDLCLKLMSEDKKELSKKDIVFACEYFKKNGLEWKV